MSVLACVVAADEDEVIEVGCSPQPLVSWSGCQLPDFDTAKLTALHCLLTGDDYDYALSRHEPVFVGVQPDGQPGPLVLQLAHEVQERLLLLDEEQLELLSQELAATEDFEASGWDEDSCIDLLQQLADLAQLADSQGQVLLLWLLREEDLQEA